MPVSVITDLRAVAVELAPLLLSEIRKLAPELIRMEAEASDREMPACEASRVGKVRTGILSLALRLPADDPCHLPSRLTGRKTPKGHAHRMIRASVLRAWLDRGCAAALLHRHGSELP